MLNPKPKAKILIVDDNSNNLSVLGRLLKNLDYKCEFALNGKEALSRLSKESFDLILLDIVMPDMDGYEVCEKIKAQDSLQHIPIIFITIKDDLDSMVKGFEKGAVDYINKPFNSEELSARISTQIELKHSRDKLSYYIGELEDKNKYIMESINYAQYIQKHILPDINAIQTCVSEQFMIYKPKQVVSGDFYWLKVLDNQVVFSVVDCTGHGVPGALMSMVAYTALNQAVNERQLYQPAEILNYAHEYLISLFNKSGDSDFGDGMDVTVCVLDTESNILKVAGAGQKAIVNRNDELEIIAGNYRSVGEIVGVNEGYTQTELKFNKGDSIYLYSDGIVDQFSAHDDSKFSTKRLVHLIKSIQNKSMAEQEQAIRKELQNWQGDSTQIDDITIWGVKY